MAERAARLTDKMERLSLMQKPAGMEEENVTAGAKEGGRGGASCPTLSSSSSTAEEAEAITSIAHKGGVWALPADLLNLHERSTRRRLILGRTLVRANRGEEGAYYIFRALQDARASGIRCNPILYAQCLATVGSMHLISLLHHGSLTDLSHLAAAGCRDDNEMTWAAQGVLERAAGILAPCLGEGHPETVVCKANLALLLPLGRGVEVLEEAMKEVERQQVQVQVQQQQQQQQQAGGKGRRRRASGDEEKSDSSSSNAIEGISFPLFSSSGTSASPQSPLPSPPAPAAAATMPSLHAALARNKEGLQALLIAVGHNQAQVHCAVDLVAAKLKRRRKVEGGMRMRTTTASSSVSLGREGGGGGEGEGAVVSGVKEELNLDWEVEEERGIDDEPPPVLEVLWTVQGVVGVGLKGWKVKKEEEEGGGT
eukprot:evm.model.NODE_41792_length_16923_cov_32.071499.6